MAAHAAVLKPDQADAYAPAQENSILYKIPPAFGAGEKLDGQ
jgi:hypothetical protein